MSITKILDSKARQQIFSDNWQIRRRWMKWSLFFFAGNIETLISWTIYTGGNALGVQIIMSLMSAGVAILMFYIFGATFDDHSKRQFPSLDQSSTEITSESTQADSDERPEKAPAGEN